MQTALVSSILPGLCRRFAAPRRRLSSVCSVSSLLRVNPFLRQPPFRARQKINFPPSWICRMFGYVVLVAVMRPKLAVPKVALGLP